MREYISKRVAECEAMMSAESDQIRQSALRLLREMWLALANVADSMSQEELDREVAPWTTSTSITFVVEEHIEITYLPRTQARSVNRAPMRIRLWDQMATRDLVWITFVASWVACLIVLLFAA